MSGPPPGPGPPLSPEESARLAAMIRQAGNLPDTTAVVIEAITAAHVQWYRAWMTAGAPEQRAAEWTGIMVAALFSNVQP